MTSTQKHRFFAFAQNDGDNQTYRHTEALAEVSNKQNSNKRFFGRLLPQNDNISALALNGTPLRSRPLLVQAQNDHIRPKAAFTLAEVLITLGIIGIVSAMTIPSLLTNFKKRETVSKVKAAYSIFSQAVKLSIQENDEPAGWDVSNESTVAERYLIPYMTGVTEFTDANKKYSGLRTLANKPCGGVRCTCIYTWGRRKYILNNGMIFNYANTNYKHKLIVVDINGFAPPNVLGIDGFVFWIDDYTSALRTEGATYSRKQIVDNRGAGEACAPNPASYYAGLYCAALLQKDGWTMSKDYPWGNGHLPKLEE